MIDARKLIVEADRIARNQGLSQAAWSRKAGFDEFGKMVSNTMSRGNCKISVFLKLLEPLGYEITLTKVEG